MVDESMQVHRTVSLGLVSECVCIHSDEEEGAGAGTDEFQPRSSAAALSSARAAAEEAAIADTIVRAVAA